MKEKPVIFSTPMVRAILDGRKTQTRRVIKPQPVCYGENLERAHNPEPSDFFLSAEMKRLRCRRCGSDSQYSRGNSVIAHFWIQPYQFSDILWVREAFCPRYFDDGSPAYRADYDKTRIGDVVPEPKWKPSIHMPRAAARIFLRVTDVRVERVQEISPEDLRAEGIKIRFTPRELKSQFNKLGAIYETNIAREKYQMLWDDLNAKRGYGWDVNPWVWVYEFERYYPELLESEA